MFGSNTVDVVAVDGKVHAAVRLAGEDTGRQMDSMVQPRDACLEETRRGRGGCCKVAEVEGADASSNTTLTTLGAPCGMKLHIALRVMMMKERRENKKERLRVECVQRTTGRRWWRRCTVTSWALSAKVKAGQGRAGQGKTGQARRTQQSTGAKAAMKRITCPACAPCCDQRSAYYLT